MVFVSLEKERQIGRSQPKEIRSTVYVNSERLTEPISIIFPNPDPYFLFMNPGGLDLISEVV